MTRAPLWRSHGAFDTIVRMISARTIGVALALGLFASEASAQDVEVTAYGHDETDGSDVGWNALYPEPSFDDDPARRGLPNARWHGRHWWDGGRLCLSVAGLEAPFPPAHTLAIGYTVRLVGPGTFDDGARLRTFVLLRFSGTPGQRDATQCVPVTGRAPVGRPAGTIQVIAGTYGQSCGMPRGNVTAHLAGACNGRARCEYRVDHTVIGDPAYGCPKDYVAEWSCAGSGGSHRRAAAAEAGYGSIVVLECGTAAPGLTPIPPPPVVVGPHTVRIGGDGVTIEGYGHDDTDGSAVAWSSQYPNPSFDDDPARRGMPNARWRGSHRFEGGSLCLSIHDLEAPYPPAHQIAVGYTVTLHRGTFEDGSRSRTVVLHRFSGTPAQRDFALCIPVRGAAAPAGGIQVVGATYGRNCGAPSGNQTANLGTACNGRARCPYRVDYRAIGDPAYGCAKDYVADWTCGDARVRRTTAAPEAGFGSEIVLQCP